MTGNPGDDPGLNRDDRFKDDFEREAFEGLERSPGWKRDVREMKGMFRRKWGIPLLPVYLRFTMYTLATAVCLVFVFIISEKWYGLKDDLQQNKMADDITITPETMAEDTVLSMLPVEESQSETRVNSEKENISQQVSADEKTMSADNIVIQDKVRPVTAVDELKEEDGDGASYRNKDMSGEETRIIASGGVAENRKAEKKDKAKSAEGVTLGGSSIADREEAEIVAVTGAFATAEDKSESQKKGLKTYPQDYMYGLNVVDYSRIRTAPDLDGLYDVAGVDARHENKEAKTTVSKTIDQSPLQQQIPYMDFLDGAMKKFKGKMYGAALVDYELILKTYFDDLNALFYGGVCNYYLKRNDKALLYLEQVISDRTDVFFFEAEWYKALCLIQSERKDDARLLLKKIAGEGGFYSEKAANKLKELN